MSLRPYVAVLVAFSLFSSVAYADVSGDTTSSSSSSDSSGNAFASGHPDSITDSGPHTRASNLSVMGYVPWYYGFGIGVDVRYEIPIVQNGFIPKLNNSFSIEPSASLAYSTWYGFGDYGVISITPACYAIWNFYFTKKFSAYGGIGLGFSIGIVSDGYDGFDASYFFWDPVVGIHYKFGDSIAFRAELGSQAVKAGLSFYF